MSASDNRIEQFKTNILKSLKSPSPMITRKRKVNKSDANSDDSDTSYPIIESPRKKLRSSNSNNSNNNNNENEIDDDEFNQLFEIKQGKNNKNTNNNYKLHKRSRVRYFNMGNNNNDNNNENNTNEIDSMEIMDKIHEKPKNITFKCYNCDESGHIARNCPYETIKICFKCGDSGHSGFYCTNNICSLCLKSHPIHECNLFTANKTLFRFCIRCGSNEHYINQCDVLLNHRLIQLQCFVCGKNGHLNCKTLANNYKAKRIQLCSNCGSDGHTVYFCKHLKMNKAEIAIGLSTNPNEPKICFNCNEPNHCSRNCPLMIRQKQQRKKTNKHSKFHYRSNSNSVKRSRHKRIKHHHKHKKSKIDFIKQRNYSLLKIHDY